MSKRKIGLALGSGAARGVAHIGVLEVLEKEGIPIDMIAGTSAGAIVGALYAAGKDITLIRSLAMDLNTKRFELLTELALPRTGLIRGRRIEDMIKTIIGDMEFGDLKIPFACVATDIITGEEIVIKEGLVREALRASVAIPVIFTVARWRERYLVDGGLVNPVPVNVVKAMGADFTIAVNVTPDMNIEETKEPNIFSIMMRTLHIIGYQSLRASLNGADVLIEPQVASFGYFDFNKVMDFILQGELAAQNSVTEIERQLAKMHN
ncbi:MAG: patatin-like phospholipase family protein [Dehalococcoidales bacterium]|nr:patatin-like phospholipase family protein [Dehalococcoidales bacterium]